MAKKVNELDFKMYDFKKYDGLNKTFDYDHKKAEVLAEAMTERNILTKRLKYLEELAKDNQDLTPFLWTTLEGECKAIHKLDDDHLKNIMNHIVNHGGRISPQIKAEAVSRGFEVPEELTSAKAFRYINGNRLIDAEILDQIPEDIDY